MKELKLGKFNIKIEAKDIDGKDVTNAYLHHHLYALELLAYFIKKNECKGGLKTIKEEIKDIETFLKSQ